MTATIAPAPGTSPVIGAEGDDVIIATDSFYLDSGGGDDTLCVTTTHPGERDVVAGDGDDWVTLTAGRPGTEVYLGDGSDTYLGSDGIDRVYAEDFFEPVRSSGIDVIRTFGGNDMVWTGARSLPNDDSVDLGPGADSLRWEGDVGGSPTLVGGEGIDTIDVSNAGFGGRTILLGLGAPRGTVGGEQFGTWTSFEAGSIEHLAGKAVVLGSEGPDRISAFGTKGSTIEAGPGRDLVRLSGCGTAAGGRGHDRVTGQFLGGCAAGAGFTGGRGSDILRGGSGDDRLVGGPGRDAAHGGDGVDLCRPETKQSCER